MHIAGVLLSHTQFITHSWWRGLGRWRAEPSPVAGVPHGRCTRLWCCIPLISSQVAACLSREMRSWLLGANECVKCSHHPAQIGDVIFHSALPCLPLPAHLARFDRTARSNQRAFTSFNLFVWPATTCAAHDLGFSLYFAADLLIPNLPSAHSCFAAHPRHTHAQPRTRTHDTPTHNHAHAPALTHAHPRHTHSRSRSHALTHPRTLIRFIGLAQFITSFFYNVGGSPASSPQQRCTLLVRRCCRLALVEVEVVLAAVVVVSSW
jgi:hypothetical protein